MKSCPAKENEYRPFKKWNSKHKYKLRVVSLASAWFKLVASVLDLKGLLESLVLLFQMYQLICFITPHDPVGFLVSCEIAPFRTS